MKARMGRWWRFWVTLFSRTEVGTALALFRIAVGCIVLQSLVSVALTGLVEPLWFDVSHGGMSHVRGNWLVQWAGGTNPQTIWSLVIVAMATSVLVVVGLGGRLSTFVLLQSYSALTTINGDASGASDAMMSNALWLLTLSRSTATLSLDCRLRSRRWTSDQLVSAWPRYLLVFQLLVIYASTGLQKTSIAWTPAGGYSALYYSLQDPTWTRFATDLYAQLYLLTQVATFITWHWEHTASLLLLFFYYRYTRERSGRLRRWMTRWDLRKPWAVIGLGMHAGILLLMNVGLFSWVSAAYYLTLWHPLELHRAGAWAKSRIFRT